MRGSLIALGLRSRNGSLHIRHLARFGAFSASRASSFGGFRWQSESEVNETIVHWLCVRARLQSCRKIPKIKWASAPEMHLEPLQLNCSINL